jgi:hypothetical protein
LRSVLCEAAISKNGKSNSVGFGPNGCDKALEADTAGSGTFDQAVVES